MSRRKQSHTCPASARLHKPVDVLHWIRRINTLDELTHAEKSAATILATCINGTTGVTWSSLDYIAVQAGTSAEVVRRACRKLESLGVLHTTERKGRSNLFSLVDGSEPETPPLATEAPPPSLPGGLLANELTKSPPSPPSGGLVVDKSTGKNPAPTPQATRTTPASNPVFPRVRRTRRTEPPFVRAACHCDAPSEYLAPPPPRTDRRAAAAAVGGLRAALGVARE